MQRPLPPHMAAYISGQEMYKIATAMLEFVILTILGKVGFALVGRSLNGGEPQRRLQPPVWRGVKDQYPELPEGKEIFK